MSISLLLQVTKNQQGILLLVLILSKSWVLECNQLMLLLKAVPNLQQRELRMEPSLSTKTSSKKALTNPSLEAPSTRSRVQ